MSTRTELEKMLAGELYLSADAELIALRKRARRLTRAYAQTTEEDEARRRSILEELFGRIGSRVEIEPPFHCDYGRNIFAGDGLYLNTGCVILDCAEVHLGEGVLCGPYVQIDAAHHPIDAAVRASGLELATPVRIGDRVWIGGGAIVCPGVTIGSNSVIGAGSVVVKDIPPDVVAVGNPCRVVRSLR